LKQSKQPFRSIFIDLYSQYIGYFSHILHREFPRQLDLY